MTGQLTARGVGNHSFPTRIFGWIWARGVVLVTLLVALLSAVYWGVVATDRYVSEARIIVQRTEFAGGQTMDFASLLGNAGGSGRADQMLLREYLRSTDLLRKLDAALKLKAHYADSRRDFFSRMWRADASIEWFHRHFLGRVGVEFDEYSGVLMIAAQAYDPETAQAIAAMMVKEGERFMNAMARDLAREQVSFLEGQVDQMRERVGRTRQAMLDFQNRNGLVSPQATAENIVAIVARLEAQRSEVQTQLAAMQAYLVPTHPGIVQLGQKVEAIDRQIRQEQAKLVSPSARTLNRAVEEFQRLELDAAFAQEVYKTALAALEKGRVEATRTLKQVSVLQAPQMPEYSLEPRRLYNSLVFVLVALLLAGVVHLLAAIVRDHKD